MENQTIKTKDVAKGPIKQIDKAEVASDRMRTAYIQTKDKAEHSVFAAENSSEEYASDRYTDGVDHLAHKTVRQGTMVAKQGVRQIKKYRRRKAAQKAKQAANAQKQTTALARTANQGKGAAETGTKAIKQLPSGKKTIKTLEKGTGKTAVKALKAPTQKIKTAKTAVKTTQRVAKVTAKASQKATQMAKVAAKAVATGIKAAVKATMSAIRAIISATQQLIAAIAAGGWIAVLIIIIVCLVALLLGSVYGIFFSTEDSGTGITIQSVMSDINADYDAKITEICNSTTYDELEITESRAEWKEVLSVYAVKVNTDANSQQEIATMDESKKAEISNLFWEMHTISSRTETKTETAITESDDGNGNTVQTETTVTKTYLYITVEHKTTDEMAEQYGFTAEQKEYLTELLANENNGLWEGVLDMVNDNSLTTYESH